MVVVMMVTGVMGDLVQGTMVVAVVIGLMVLHDLDLQCFLLAWFDVTFFFFLVL
jgi:hypothetical protein